jgi:hypothetical protein
MRRRVDIVQWNFKSERESWSLGVNFRGEILTESVSQLFNLEFDEL